MIDTDNITPASLPTGEVAKLICNLLSTGRLFIEHNHNHVYTGTCKTPTIQFEIQVDCQEEFVYINGDTHKISYEDTFILYQEIARQASSRLAKTKKYNLVMLRQATEE